MDELATHPVSAQLPVKFNDNKISNRRKKYSLLHAPSVDDTM